MLFTQDSFLSGLDLLSKDFQIAGDGYEYLINGRCRFGYPEPIVRSKDITGAIMGKKQGLYAVGNIQLLFAAGNAYYKSVDSITWVKIANFHLDPSVEYIYAQAVPGSTSNFLRQGVVNTDTNKIDTKAGIIQTPFSVNGTPAGVVCQDGINQPFIILYDSVNNIAICRRLGTYDSWTIDTVGDGTSMEYVPIGTRMMFMNQILFIVSGNQVFRSVSGSPLNFMVNVDKDGNKLSSEALGGANSVSFAQDFNQINALVPSSAANTFLLCTSRNIYGMTIDYTNTIFAEPTFTVSFVLEAGVVNQFCVTDINGDTACIDFEGVKDFNAIQQLKFEGRNDRFSQSLSKILVDNHLRPIAQDVCCCEQFNNYNTFALKTSMGYLFGIYDNIIGKWIALDVTSVSTGKVKQFAVSATPDRNRFFAITAADDKVWEIFGDDNLLRETAILKTSSLISSEDYRTRASVTQSDKREHKSNSLTVIASSGTYDGTMMIRELVDDQRTQILTKDINGVISSIAYPVVPPVVADSKPRVDNLNFGLKDKTKTGFKIGAIISWDNDAKLLAYEFNTTGVDKQVSLKQSEKVFTTSRS